MSSISLPMLVAPIQPPMVSCDAHNSLVSNVIFWSPIAQGTAREEQGKLSVTMNVLCTSLHTQHHIHSNLEMLEILVVIKYALYAYTTKLTCIHIHNLHTCSRTRTHTHRRCLQVYKQSVPGKQIITNTVNFF